MAFILFIAFLISIRLIELFVAKRNEKWLIQNGAVEFGKEHYPFIVALHVFFIASLITELFLKGVTAPNLFLLITWIILIILKIYVISSLGKYWNTKIFRIPGSPSVRSGLYNYIKHPNYIIVVTEIMVIPLIFKLYITATLFSVLNAIMLRIRITEENKVWNNPDL